MQKILRLIPSPAGEVALEGAYLDQDLRKSAENHPKPLVYANFISSLDGRIAVPRSEGGGLTVPKATANERDWRLFQELTAQADIILSSGRYLRDWAAGRAQEILQIEDSRFADLREWRERRGLRAYPDIAILSASLDFEVPGVLLAGGRKAIVFTTENANQNRIEELKPQVSQVIPAGEERVEGRKLIKLLQGMGYRTIYSSAGPQVLHMLLSDNVLDRLYLTLAPRLLGGKPFASILEGSLMTPPPTMKLLNMYFDGYAFDGNGQIFLTYEIST